MFDETPVVEAYYFRHSLNWCANTIQARSHAEFVCKPHQLDANKIWMNYRIWLGYRSISPTKLVCKPITFLCLFVRSFYWVCCFYKIKEYCFVALRPSLCSHINVILSLQRFLFDTTWPPPRIIVFELNQMFSKNTYQRHQNDTLYRLAYHYIILWRIVQCKLRWILNESIYDVVGGHSRRINVNQKRVIERERDKYRVSCTAFTHTTHEYRIKC